MEINDNHPRIVELYKNFNYNNFMHYIDLKNCDFLKSYITNNDVKYYQSKKDPHLILKVNYYFPYVELLYSKNGKVEDDLQFYNGIPNRFRCDRFFEKIIEINWFTNEDKLYNPNGPSKIKYDYDGKFKFIEWTNENGLQNKVDFPACLIRGVGEFFKYYSINGYNLTEKHYNELIENVKSGKVKRNINRYSNIDKLKVLKIIAKYYNLTETVQAIEDKFLLLKLQGKKV